MELANGCLEIFAALIIVLLYMSMRQKGSNDFFEKNLTLLIICHIMVLLLDALRWFLCQYEYFEMLLTVLSIAPTILSLLGNAIFAYFTICLLSKRGSITWKINYLFVFLLALAIMIWTVFILLNGIPSAVNLQTSHDAMSFNWAYWMGHFSWASVCILGIVVLLRCRHALNSNELWSLLSYCMFPLIALILRFFWDGPQIFLSTSLALIWIYVVMQKAQQQRLQEQEAQLVKSRIAILLSQIQPHFLYNTLTVICGLCDENPKKAKEVTTEFADYLRLNLDSLSHNNLIPFLDELQHTKLYLAIEKTRFEDKLNVVYNINTENFLLPALTVQPIVENAVKHGIHKTINGGTIIISTIENKECYEISVSDDGIGFDNHTLKIDNKLHIGFENVRERLWVMCRGTISIESEINKGTAVIIKIPRGGNS